MDIYTYVAHSNPYQAKAILHKYGYSTKGVSNNNDLGVCLKQLVAYEGENAFNDILSSHPDSNVIVERYTMTNPTKEVYNSANGGCNCGCSHCKGNDRNYHNFSGNPDSTSSRSKVEASVFIMAAALLIAAAIIVKK